MKSIPDKYFQELLKYGHTVPRNLKTGSFIKFTVGKSYLIKNSISKEIINVKCTQNCPYNLILTK